MNFIDTALANQNNLTDDDFLQAMASIYEEPEVWDILDTYPDYIQDVVYIIDYDTELQMEGFEACVSSEKSQRYINALINSGATDEANILQEAGSLDPESEDYWEQVAELESQTSLYNDYEFFWTLVRNYIRKNRM